jgi:hypothetical protein
MNAAARLYDLIAARCPDAVVVLDRQSLDEQDCIGAIADACLTAPMHVRTPAEQGGSR